MFNKSNTPDQNYIENGCFVLDPKLIKSEIVCVTKVALKGLRFLYNKINDYENDYDVQQIKLNLDKQVLFLELNKYN